MQRRGRVGPTRRLLEATPNPQRATGASVLRRLAPHTRRWRSAGGCRLANRQPHVRRRDVAASPEGGRLYPRAHHGLEVRAAGGGDGDRPVELLLEKSALVDEADVRGPAAAQCDYALPRRARTRRASRSLRRCGSSSPQTRWRRGRVRSPCAATAHGCRWCPIRDRCGR